MTVYTITGTIPKLFVYNVLVNNVDSNDSLTITNVSLTDKTVLMQL